MEVPRRQIAAFGRRARGQVRIRLLTQETCPERGQTRREPAQQDEPQQRRRAAAGRQAPHPGDERLEHRVGRRTDAHYFTFGPSWEGQRDRAASIAIAHAGARPRHHEPCRGRRGERGVDLASSPCRPAQGRDPERGERMVSQK